MPLWSTTDTNLDSGKPKYLSDQEKTNTFATQGGWVYRQGGTYTDSSGNVRRKDEILVAAGSLANTLSEATISGIAFSQSTGDVNGSYSAVVEYNEAVDVFGSPTLTVQVANTTANVVPSTITATYSGTGNNTNRVYFDFTAYSNAASYTFSNTGVTVANTQALQIVDNTANTVAADLTVPGLYTGANSVIGTLATS